MKKNADRGYEKTKPKQTQSNPICGEQSRTTCSELACTACPEFIEGSLPALSLVEVSNQSKGSNLFQRQKNVDIPQAKMANLKE